MEFSTYFNRFFLFSLVPLVKAYTVFETTCSAPNQQSEFLFVSSPNTRGTLSILWSSLFTLFACTWTLQHPDIPRKRTKRDVGPLGGLGQMLKDYRYNTAVLMVITILAPEWIIGMSVSELQYVCRIQQEMQKYNYAEIDGVAWTLTHSYYADMGGFAIKQSTGNIYHLSFYDICKLRQEGLITSLPDIKAQEIKDKSKSDKFGKAVAVCQIVWTLVQAIARVAEKLPVSPLEIAIVAFAICAVIIYGLNWYKPQRVVTPYYILDYMNYDDKTRILAEIESRDIVSERISRISEPQITTTRTKPINKLAHLFAEADKDICLLVFTAISAAVFGGVHLIAWNFAFPTTVELIFWRCASAYLSAFPLVVLFAFGIEQALKALFNLSFRGEDILFKSLLAFCVGFYVMARLVIIVEMFRTLFFLPAGSFVSTWSTNFPHFD